MTHLFKSGSLENVSLYHLTIRKAVR